MNIPDEVKLKVQNAVQATANAHGLNVTTEQVESVTMEAAKLLSDFVLHTLEKKVEQEKDAAVQGINTLEEAEKSARRKR